MSFITKKNILNDSQHGFREGKTETAAHAFLENIQKATEKKINLIGILHIIFWVVPWHVVFNIRRFGTLCLFHLHR
jgi:hypothetical protein